MKRIWIVRSQKETSFNPRPEDSEVSVDRPAAPVNVNEVSSCSEPQLAPGAQNPGLAVATQHRKINCA
jgi:hypothetical protein